MDGWKISYFLSMDSYTSKCFRGFAMSDFGELPGKKTRKCLYILNTDHSSGPGKHWCLLFVEKRNADFFDPLGMSPDVYNFRHFLHGYKIKYNTSQVQGMFSKVCGYHCLFFAYYRCRGYSMEAILDMYEIDNTDWNDKMVVSFMLKFGKFYAPE